MKNKQYKEYLLEHGIAQSFIKELRERPETFETRKYLIEDVAELLEIFVEEKQETESALKVLVGEFYQEKEEKNPVVEHAENMMYDIEANKETIAKDAYKLKTIATILQSLVNRQEKREKAFSVLVKYTNPPKHTHECEHC